MFLTKIFVRCAVYGFMGVINRPTKKLLMIDFLDDFFCFVLNWSRVINKPDTIDFTAGFKNGLRTVMI